MGAGATRLVHRRARRHVVGLIVGALCISTVPAIPRAVGAEVDQAGRELEVESFQPEEAPPSASAHIPPPGPEPRRELSRPPIPEIPKERWSSFSHHLLGDDGLVRAELFLHPAFRNIDGTWERIDTSLHAGTGDVVASAPKAIRPLTFGRSADRLWQLDDGERRVTLSSPDVTVREAELTDEGTVTYRNVAPDTDLVYRVGPGQIKEELVLRSPAAPRSFRFHIADPSGRLGEATADADGGFSFSGRIDDAALRLAPAVAYEESTADDAGFLPDPDSARLSLEPTPTGFDVTVTADEEWIDGRPYPIVLDPTITIGGTHNHPRVRNFWARAVPSCGWTSCLVGTFEDKLGVGTGVTPDDGHPGTPNPEPHVDRSYMRFDLSEIVLGSTIQAATLDLFLFDCVSWVIDCRAQPNTVGLHRVTGSTAVPASLSWGALDARTAPSAFASKVVPGSAYSGLGEYFAFPGMGPQVQRWVSRQQANQGFVLRLPDESPPAPGVVDYRGGPVFHGNAFPSPGGRHPRLTVTYQLPPPPAITKAISPVKNVYARGDAAAYTLTVRNTSPTPQRVGVVDFLPAGLVATGRILVDGVACPPGGEPDCTLIPSPAPGFHQQVGVAMDLGPVGSATATRTVTYDATIIGSSERGCAPVTNTAAAFAAGGTNVATNTILVCDSALGLEPWWSVVSEPVGSGGLASVNVASGNLVLQQLDSTPVQARGRLALAVRRTYNSQATASPADPGGFGVGWTLNVGQADALSGAGAFASGLQVPDVESGPLPAPVVLVDRDGTRHVFRPKPMSDRVDVTGLVSTTGPHSPLVASALAASGGARLCADQVYEAPDGVHLSLWRYVQVNHPSCAVSSGATPIVVGYGAIRPDRLRSEFSADGRLVSLSDGAGVKLTYEYEAAPVGGVLDLGRLKAVYESDTAGACPASVSTCRALRFDYTYYDPTTKLRLQTARVADIGTPGSAGSRTTVYHFDDSRSAAGSTGRLTRVDNPDGSSLTYAYGFCGGTESQLCAATDARGSTTRFAYAADTRLAGSGAPAGAVTAAPRRLVRIEDRRGTQTLIAYNDPADYVSADTAGQRRRFQDIDDVGRVGHLHVGTTADVYLQSTVYTWDTDAAPCRQPTAAADNNLCRMVRGSLTLATPAEDTAWTYNDEGQVIRETRAHEPPSVTTHGYRAQHVRRDGTVTTTTDSVGALGSVTTPARPASSDVVYVVSDRTETLTPRGNRAPAASVGAFKSTYVVDSNTAVGPGVQTATHCADPAVPTGNSGLLCRQTRPSPTGTGHVNTDHAYNGFGQRTSTTDANGTTTTYTYYSDATLDLTSTVTAGGWLKGVTDGDDEFVVFAYDAAGNVARVWDRDATDASALSLSAYPGTLASPAAGGFSETRWGPTHAAPWRWPLAQTDPLGNTTTWVRDANGNPLQTTTPRGNATAAAGDFTTHQTFDVADRVTRLEPPVQRAASAATVYAYDARGNLVRETDPEDGVTLSTYDAADRQTRVERVRGPVTSGSSTPPGCEARAADNPSARANSGPAVVVCYSEAAYDGVDNVIASRDGAGAVSTFTFDALHREVRRTVPRQDGTHATLTSGAVYDADGNVVLSCPPREFTDGSGDCATGGSPRRFSAAHTYNPAGMLTRTTTYRQNPDSPGSWVTLTSGTAYDANGNAVLACPPREFSEGTADCAANATPRRFSTTSIYDDLNRLTEVRVPFDSAATDHTRRFEYSPSGDRTAVLGRGATTTFDRITAYRYDAAHRLVDVVEGAASSDADASANFGGAGTAGLNARTRYHYDADGNVAAVFEPRAFASATGPSSTPDASFATRVTYDANDRVTAVASPRYGPGASDIGTAGEEQATECPTGHPDYPAGVGVCRVAFAYDLADRTVARTLPAAAGDLDDDRVVRVSYTHDDLLATVTGPSPESDDTAIALSSYTYDGAGRALTSTDAGGFVSATSYFADGLVSKVVTPPSETGVTHEMAYGYDADGRVVTEQDNLNASPKTTTYFADGLVRSVADPGGHTIRYAYDTSGNVTRVTDPNGHSTTHTFSNNNLPATTRQPVDATTWRRTTWAYDLGGRKTTQQVALVDASGTLKPGGDGGAQDFSWYPNDRLATETGRADEGVRPTISYEYDQAGQTTQMTLDSNPLLPGGERVTASEWYLDGLVRRVHDPTTVTDVETAYAYDAAGTVAVRRHQAGAATRVRQEYDFGDAGLPTAMRADALTGGGSWEWAYDELARPVSQEAPNGQTTAWEWHDDSTLESVALSDSSGNTVATWSYSYDALYRITGQTHTGTPASGTTNPDNGTWTYGYDPAGRVDSVDFDGPGGAAATDVAYDPAGNRTAYGTKTWTYNRDNSIATFDDSADTDPVTSFQYHPFGGLEQDECSTYAYDGFDRVRKVEQASCGGRITTNAYDALDRVVRRTSVVGLDSSIADFAYDGLSSKLVAADADAATTTSDTFAYGVSMPMLAHRAGPSGGERYLTNDGNGNVSYLVDDAQTPVCTTRFDPFGEPHNATGGATCTTENGAAVVSQHWYRAGHLDEGTGTYQFGARTYNPATASWLTPDTFRNLQPPADLSVGVDPLTQNRYTYVNGDPLNLADPTGHGAVAPEPVSEEEVVAFMTQDFEQNWAGGVPDGWEEMDYEKKLTVWMASRINSVGIKLDEKDIKAFNTGSIQDRIRVFQSLGDEVMEGPGCANKGLRTAWGVGKWICENPETVGKITAGLNVIATGATIFASFGAAAALPTLLRESTKRVVLRATAGAALGGGGDAVAQELLTGRVDAGQVAAAGGLGALTGPSIGRAKPAGPRQLNLPFRDPALRTQVDDVVRHIDELGAPPDRVVQGGLRGQPKGAYGNLNNALPKRELGYYTESDVWTSGPGVKRGAERLVLGRGGEVYYSPNHYRSFVQIR